MEITKIFVSHRIDIDSELIDNPIYVPVRCGAIFDDKNTSNILGDDTGDHISDKRMSFCEFTVQYWAWKNQEADYYGMCHYRRYLSFSEKKYKTDDYNMVFSPALLPLMKKKYNLLDLDFMSQTVSKYDIITSYPADVNTIVTPLGKKETVEEMWRAYDHEFFEEKSIDKMFSLIETLSPEYSESAKLYFSSTKHRGFNCFVLKKDIFKQLCEFQFPIIFALDEWLDTTGYTQTMKRTPAFIGEMLYGIFLFHIMKTEKFEILQLQLVFFRDTANISSPFLANVRFFSFILENTVRRIVDPLFPKGSQRREKIKDIVFFLLPIERKGVASIKDGK